MSFSGRVGADRDDKAQVPGLTDTNVTDLSVFAAQFPLYFDEGLGIGAPLYVTWGGGFDLIQTKEVVLGSVRFGEELGFLKSGRVVAAGALRWNYGLSADLRSRPVVGQIEREEDAQTYWEATYGLKFA